MPAADKGGEDKHINGNHQSLSHSIISLVQRGLDLFVHDLAVTRDAAPLDNLVIDVGCRIRFGVQEFEKGGNVL